MKKKLLAIILILSITIPMIPTNIVIASTDGEAKYNSWKTITFSEKSSSNDGNKVAITSQMVGWHYSGGNWKFTLYGSSDSISITDKQMGDIMQQKLLAKELSKYIEVKADLPSNIKTYLNNGGDISQVNITFDSGKMNPKQIYDGDLYYYIDKANGKVIVAFKPVFNVSDKPIYGKTDDNGKKTGMNIQIPQGKPGYGFTTFALYDKKGTKLGSAYDINALNNLYWGIPDTQFLRVPDDIADSKGNLKNSLSSVKDADRKILYNADNGSGNKLINIKDARIGSNTFANGGAVGVGFFFPINATFYIQDTSYSIVSTGYLSDGTHATVDFIDSEGLLDGTLQGIQNALKSMGRVGSDGMGGIMLDFDVSREALEKVSSKDVDRALELAKEVFTTDEAKDMLTKYILSFSDEYSKMLMEAMGESEDALPLYQDAIERDISIRILQYIMDNNLADKYGLGKYGAHSSEILYKGTDTLYRDPYYRMYASLLKKDNTSTNIIGIDKKFQTKLYEKLQVPIAYLSMVLDTKYTENVPKSLLKQIVDSFTEDLTIEARKISLNTAYTQKAAIRKIVDKWVPSNQYNEAHRLAMELVNSPEQEAIFEIVTDSNLCYGDYNSSIGKYSAIRINELYAIRLLKQLIFYATMNDNIYDQIKDTNYTAVKTFKDDRGKTIRLGDLFKAYDISVWQSGYWYYAIANKVSIEGILNEKLNELTYGAASNIKSSDVEAIVRVAVAEAADVSKASVEENPDGTLNIEGAIGASLVLFNEGIPVDLYIVSTDENGVDTVIGVQEGFTGVVPNYVKEIPLVSQLTINGKNINVNKAVIKPASIDVYKFLDLATDAINANNDYVTYGNAVSRILTPQQDKLELMKFTASNEDSVAYNNNKNNKPAIVLYVDGGNTPKTGVVSNVSGDLILAENMVTKSFTLTDINPTLSKFTFSYDSAGTHTHWGSSLVNGVSVPYSYSVNRDRGVDTSYKYVIKPSNGLNANAITLTGIFNLKNNTNVLSGTARWDGGSTTMTPNFYFDTWRAKDLPTLASYKENSNNPLVAVLGLGIDKVPKNARNAQGGYTENIYMVLKQSTEDYADYITQFTCGDSPRTQYHTSSDSAEYSAMLGVKTYIGVANNGNIGTNFVSNSFTAQGINFTRAKGHATQSGKLIKFYPYVQMGYQLPGGNVTNVNVLAGHESIIRPIDYVEVGWVNPNVNNSLTLNSNQWSTYARAVSKWGKNNVLPGGAIYTLDTKTNKTKVAVTTWQAYVHNSLLPAITDGSTYYTLDAAVARDNDVNSQVKASLEALDVVQYVDRDSTKSNAFGGIKLNAAGGQDVYGNKTSNDAKYWLKRGTSAGSPNANEADIDIVAESGKTRTFYKVTADVNGNVVISESTNGTNWATLQTLTRAQTIANITNAKVKALDDRTKIVSNFITALDRNQGSDPAAWYNEAWDGVMVVKTDTVYDVGFNKPVTRSAALDPKLTPVKASTSDIFNKAYISQFRLNQKSAIHTNRPDGYVARFNGTDIIIPDMHNMYQSRPFYIPNATVMDLY